MRDMLVTTGNKLTLYLATNDQNPTILITFRDTYENLLPYNKTLLNYNF
jgi:hypothetical protein